MTKDRKYWLDTLIRITEPVLSNMAEGKLRAVMPVEAKQSDRFEVTHLEALGRTLAGVAPWLETPSYDQGEEKARTRMAELARRAISHAVDPASPDFCHFTAESSRQPLVDAAFLCHGILRAPHELWEGLDSKTKSLLITALKTTRAIQPFQSNWLLFSAIIEATLYMMTGECDVIPVDHALSAHESWYKGDGIYGDGPLFAWDYYNSYVIQPMLVDVIRTLHNVLSDSERMEKNILARARRFAAIQERMIGIDGTFPVIGRSITYRTGAFQALAQMALIDQLPDDIAPAQVRCALTAVIKRCFEAEGTFDAYGWLTIGLCGHQPALGEFYISTGSLYLCTVAFLPLGLPAEHPFWSAPDAPYTAQKAWGGVDLAADHAQH